MPQIEIEEIALSKQKELLRDIPVDQIPAGTAFHLQTVALRLPDNFLLMDLGCGIGKKTALIAEMAICGGKGGNGFWVIL